jgi:hypothetical protein
VLTVPKYSLDLRLKGNRAPMMLGVHTDEYTEENPYFRPKSSTVADRREAIEKFLEYALSKKEVRVVPMRDILAWTRGAAGVGDTDTIDDSDSVDDTETSDDTDSSIGVIGI